MYKNKAMGLEELRKRREEEGVQLRKQKREEQVCIVYNWQAISILKHGLERHSGFGTLLFMTSSCPKE